jgi:hypothetical protein
MKNNLLLNKVQVPDEILAEEGFGTDDDFDDLVEII